MCIRDSGITVTHAPSYPGADEALELHPSHHPTRYGRRRRQQPQAPPHLFYPCGRVDGIDGPERIENVPPKISDIVIVAELRHQRMPRDQSTSRCVDAPQSMGQKKIQIQRGRAVLQAGHGVHVERHRRRAQRIKEFVRQCNRVRPQQPLIASVAMPRRELADRLRI